MIPHIAPHTDTKDNRALQSFSLGQKIDKTGQYIIFLKSRNIIGNPIIVPVIFICLLTFYHDDVCQRSYTGKLLRTVLVTGSHSCHESAVSDFIPAGYDIPWIFRQKCFVNLLSIINSPIGKPF